MNMREHHTARARHRLELMKQRAEKAGVLKPLEQFLAPMLNLSPYTLHNYASIFVYMAERFGWPFTEISAAEIAKWIDEVNGETQRHRLRIAKMILRWVYDDELPKEIRRLKLRGVRRVRQISKEDLPTAGEVRRIRDAMHNFRDKAFFMVMVGTGLRIGEMLSMRVKDVIEEQGVTRIWVDGKVGRYKAFVATYAVPWLRRWTATFDVEDENLPLWPSSRKPKQPLSDRGATFMLRRAVKRSGIEKRIYLHLFRHRRNTELSETVGPEKASIIQHYSMGSPVLKRRYTHFSEQDYLRLFHESEGTQPAEPLEPEPIDEPKPPMNCPRCNAENDARFRFCGGCGQPLVEEALGDIAEAEALVDQILRTLLENPDLMRQLKDRAQKS